VKNIFFIIGIISLMIDYFSKTILKVYFDSEKIIVQILLIL